MPASHLLTLRDLCARLGWGKNRIMRMVGAGEFPPPMNAEQTRDYRWHVAVVESYERGEWRRPGLVRPPMVGLPAEPVRLPKIERDEDVA